VVAVKAATMGAAVKWFVVSPPTTADAPATQDQVVLSQQALKEIADAGGKVELAGSDSSNILLPQDDQQSAIRALSAWCGVADTIICTYDGVDIKDKKQENEDRKVVWKNAIKVAAAEATRSVSGNKIAILSADEAVVSTDDGEDGKGGIGSVVGSLFGNKMTIPASLAEAMAPQGADNTLTLRYGQLFGTPESSPDFSPLLGGPKKDPQLCEEFLMRSVRVDPTLSVSGNVMLSGSTTRSSRHAIGEAAALMAFDQVPVQTGLDVSVSSQLGSDPVPVSSWKEEFLRVQDMLSSGKGAQLFSTEFGSVPVTSRLADWLATKWAPAVLRTYDIAAIRIGARPVYVLQPEPDTVEIVWQQLVDFESVIVGKMIIQVSDTGLVALRGSGDAKRGYGEISRVPLAGEDVLVRRLAEAASQAVEKGLANKPSKTAVEVAEPAVPAEPVPEVAVVSSIQSAGTVAKPKARTGPRQAGVRRSKERSRGKRRKAAPTDEE